MSVKTAYTEACHGVGVGLGWVFVGSAFGTGSGSLAALALGIQQKAGLIFGATSGGVSLSLFQAFKPTPSTSATYSFRIASAAVVSVLAGAASGYATLEVADEPPSPRTYLKLAFLTCGFGISTLLCLRCAAKRCCREQPASQHNGTHGGYLFLDPGNVDLAHNEA